MSARIKYRDNMPSAEEAALSNDLAREAQAYAEAEQAAAEGYARWRMEWVRHYRAQNPAASQTEIEEALAEECAQMEDDPRSMGWVNDYHEALRELLRLKRKQREMIAEAGRLGDMAKWAEYRIEVALAKGATP